MWVPRTILRPKLMIQVPTPGSTITKDHYDYVDKEPDTKFIFPISHPMTLYSHFSPSNQDPDHITKHTPYYYWINSS